MNIYYLDASAWVKRYYHEVGTSWIEELFLAGSPMACASLGLVEAIAALVRKAKAQEIEDALLERLCGDVMDDWAGFIRIRFTADILDSAVALARRFALRGADAVHLASALALQRQVIGENERVILVASDRELKESARSSQLDVLDPAEEQMSAAR